MNLTRILFLISTIFALSASAAVKKNKPIFHLDLEASSQEIEKTLAQELRKPYGPALYMQKDPDSQNLDRIVSIGKRNLDWLRYINQHRETPLKFTKPGSLIGIPITAPNRNSGTIVMQKYADFVAQAPTEMVAVLDRNAPFTEQPPVPDEMYIEWGLKMDKIYQSALRWKLMQPYLNQYAARRQYDIRGFYFLKNTPDLESRLKNWSQNSEEDKAQFREWLQSECYNTYANDTACAREVQNAEPKGAMWELHQKYWSQASNIYNDFFVIENPRRDLIWSSNNQNLAWIPVLDPVKQEYRDYLKINLEDEWKWLGWQLNFDLQKSARARVIWQPGVTPHVDGLGGNNVFMDSNAPLTEWDVQWTIRHEFGHVFGLPDCYVEFYDAREQAMINYQIDIEDLMCSRRGRMNQRIFDEMKRNYLKN